MPQRDNWDTWEPSRDYPQAPPARSNALGPDPVNNPPRSPRAEELAESLAADLGFLPPEPVDETDSAPTPTVSEAAAFFDQFSEVPSATAQTPAAAAAVGGQREAHSQGANTVGSGADGAGQSAVSGSQFGQRPGQNSTAGAQPGVSGLSAGVQDLIAGWERIPQTAQKPNAPAPQQPPLTAPFGAVRGQDTAPPVMAHSTTVASGQKALTDSGPATAALAGSGAGSGPASPMGTKQTGAGRSTVQGLAGTAQPGAPGVATGSVGAPASEEEKARRDWRRRNNRDETKVSVRRVGSGGGSAGTGRDYNLALFGLVLLLALLIGVGFGTLLGMNLAPQVVQTVGPEPSGPAGENGPDQSDPLRGTPSAGTGSGAAGPYNPLAGMKIALDAGHNGGNAAAWQRINQQVPDGRGRTKECDTTGTATDDGYSEAQFNWEVVSLVKKKLEDQGAQVFLTRNSNTGVGPCVDERGRFSQTVGAELMVYVHANGTADKSVNGFFAMISDPPLNESQGARSQELAQFLIDALKDHGFKPQTTYPGGLYKRPDLATLNIAQRPATMLELGEMRNPADSALMKTEEGRQRYASAIYDGIRAWALKQHPEPAASASPSGASGGGSPEPSGSASPQ